MVVDRFSDGQETAVLCSAGLDSAVLLADEATRGWVTPVYVSVGLAWEAAERRALEQLLASPPFATRVRPPQILEFSMRDIYPPAHWAVAGVAPAFDTPDEDVYLVGRNVVLLTKAGILAAQRKLGRVAMGTLAGNPFPDATPAFVTSMAEALSRGLAHPLTIATPFRDLHKDAVVRLGVQLGVPLERSLSCMQPVNDLHCGHCSKCRERRDAFLAADVPDPTVYATPPAR
jgi:7-cyano-7-deazaguanine synthase